MKSEAAPSIPESFLEHRLIFAAPWVDQWILPNPFISPLHSFLKQAGVALTDFSFNKDASSIGDTFLNVVVRKLNASFRVGLDSVVFNAVNPDWMIAAELASLFDQVAGVVRATSRSAPVSQETTLALHIVSETTDLGTATSLLVRKELLGEAEFYGVTLNQDPRTIMIDKSQRFPRAAFVRVHRRSGGDDSFAAIVAALYADEVFALKLLGLAEASGV